MRIHGKKIQLRASQLACICLRTLACACHGRTDMPRTCHGHFLWPMNKEVDVGVDREAGADKEVELVVFNSPVVAVSGIVIFMKSR